MGKPRSRVFGVLCLMVLLSLPAVPRFRPSPRGILKPGSLFADHKAAGGDLSPLSLLKADGSPVHSPDHYRAIGRSGDYSAEAFASSP